MDGWVALLGGHVDNLVATYVTNVVVQLAAALTPLVLGAMTLWWFYTGWSVMRGEVRETVPTILFNVVKISLILIVALNAATYNDFVVDTADGLRDGMANVFGVAIDAGDTVTTQATVWDKIDEFDRRGSLLLARIGEETSWYNVPMWFACGLIAIAQAILTIAALFIALITKVFMSFFLAVGPIFIAGLAFRPTQRFFDGWLGMILNMIVLSWIGLFVLGFSTYLMGEFAVAVESGWDTLQPVATGAQYLAMSVIFAVMLFQARNWAAALAGGSAVQTGMSMLTQALIVRSGVAGANARRSSAGAAGNAVASGSRAFGMGSAVGSGVRSMGRFVRSARFRMAALRGRS